MRINVRLTPNAKHQRMVKETSLLGEEVYKIYLPEKPVNNQANKALIAFLSDHFGVRKWLIRIVQWAKSRNKVIAIDE